MERKQRVKPIVSEEEFVRPGSKDWVRRQYVWRDVASMTTIPTPAQLQKRAPFALSYPTALKWIQTLFGDDWKKKG